MHAGGIFVNLSNVDTGQINEHKGLQLMRGFKSGSSANRRVSHDRRFQTLFGAAWMPPH